MTSLCKSNEGRPNVGLKAKGKVKSANCTMHHGPWSLPMLGKSVAGPGFSQTTGSCCMHGLGWEAPMGGATRAFEGYHASTGRIGYYASGRYHASPGQLTSVNLGIMQQYGASC